jgi:hypothetical protein
MIMTGMLTAVIVVLRYKTSMEMVRILAEEFMVWHQANGAAT